MKFEFDPNKEFRIRVIEGGRDPFDRRALAQAVQQCDHMRLAAEALGGPGLSGMSPEEQERLITTTPTEQSALRKLLAYWRVFMA